MHKSGSDGKFTSSIGFVLAAVGSAVGMANIWLFPYRVGQYGGGAFLIPYFLFVALFSYVGLSGEFALGRLTGTGAMGSLDYVLRQRGRRGGRVLGAIPLLGVLGIAIGYSVVVGWVLRYAAGSLTGSVLAGDAQGFFSALAVDFGSIPWHFAAVAVTAAILIFGVASGIEKLSKVMMPAFFILFLIIAVRVAFLPGAMEGYLYLLRPDWSYLLNPETWVMAMGQAFFSLSINGAGMLIYGSYMKKGENILRHAGMTAVLDTLAALLAGFAILPAVFAFGIDPTSGPQLMFVTLPQIFQQMPGGRIFALLFFVSVFFAGITSLMNMLEACGEALTSTFRLSRTVSTLLVGAAAFLPGLFLESLAGMGGWMDLITIYVSPFGALLVAVCIYFVLGMKDIGAELALGLLQQLHGLELHHVALVLPGHQGDLVLRQPGLQGGFLRGLADGAQAEGREHHAPPVQPAPRADLDAQGGVRPCREGEVGIGLGGEPVVVHQGGGHRIGIARLPHHLRPGGGQVVQVGAEELLCLRPAGSRNKQLLRLSQNPVPHPELEGLVGLGIRVGQHVQADHLVGQGRLGPVQPHPQQSRAGHPQQQRQLPAAQGLGLLHKTSPSTM